MHVATKPSLLTVPDPAFAEAVTRWLGRFEQALAASDSSALSNLFLPEAHWRDLVALTWRVKTVSGAAAISAALTQHAKNQSPAGFQIDSGRSAPRIVTRAGVEMIEAFFRFETAQTRAQGVLRLDPAGAIALAPRAWTLFTAADEIKGFEEHTGSRRPRGESYSRDFKGPNWLDKRRAAAAYDDRDPAVLVVGGGQAGLSIGARLTQLNVDALVVDRGARVGDNWRKRYHALTLHNQVQVNHLPYMPYPPSFPTYIPKDKLAAWFESYAESMEINFWTSTRFSSGSYDDEAQRWSVELRCADGSVRTMHPRHVIMATGASDIPKMPQIFGLEQFKGRVMHASQYNDASEWVGRRALVIGTGTSGHDVAQDLYSNGAKVTLVQRSPTLVVDIEPSAQLPYALYNEGRPLEETDLIAASTPMALFEKSHRLMARQSREMDAELLAGLTRAGFRINTEDETGWQIMYLKRGGGYYFNVGCSNLIIEGKIPVLQYADIAAFTVGGAQLKSGAMVDADLVVLATGYEGQSHLVRKLFGDAIADCAGPVWGIDPALQELHNMWCPTGQPGLWFIAGSFAQCRIYSKYLALQIKAREEGLIPPQLA